MTIDPYAKRAIIAGVAVATLATSFLLGGSAGYGTARYTAPDTAACLAALDRADQTFTLIDDRNEAIVDGLDAYQVWDADGIDQATADIEAIDERIDALQYPDARDDCRQEIDR